MFSVNFKNGEGEKAINAYIKEKTHGIIDSDIKLSPYTLITLINTFYLKEVWNDDGDELKFTDNSYNFKNADGSVITKEVELFTWEKLDYVDKIKEAFNL